LGHLGEGRNGTAELFKIIADENLPKPTRPSQQAGSRFYGHFSRAADSDFQSLRGDIKSLFGASVSGDKNPVPDSTRKKVREGLARQARKKSRSARRPD